MKGGQSQPRCNYCGRYFKPDYRHRTSQKSCKRLSCKKRRKQESQSRWIQKNPDYFKGRYPDTKIWRNKHPDYQKRLRNQQRAKKCSEIQDSCAGLTPMKSIRLLVPAFLVQSEIQDTMVYLTLLDTRSYIVTAGGVRYKIHGKGG